MKHVVKHDLGKEKAKQVAEKAMESYKERFAKYSPTGSWNGDRADIGFTAKGIKLSGALEVKESAIEMDLDVPFVLKPFKGKAIGVIEEEIQKWIAKAKAGDI